MNNVIKNILLLFKPFKYRKEETKPFTHPYGIKYKILFGKEYIYSIFPIPPKHMNCRCVLTPLIEKNHD